MQESAQATVAKMQPLNWQGMTANLGPVVRILRQHEDDKSAGMMLSTSDVRAMVDEINSLAKDVRECQRLIAWQKEQARLTHMALLENDVALADEFARRVADDANLTPAGYK